MKVVYISGPYSHGDIPRNVAAAMQAWNELRDAHCAPVCPHLTMYLHMMAPRDYESWMSYDLALLERCDAIVRLDGYSPGADREVARAVELGLPVLHGTSEAKAWLDAHAG